MKYLSRKNGIVYLFAVGYESLKNIFQKQIIVIITVLNKQFLNEFSRVVSGYALHGVTRVRGFPLRNMCVPRAGGGGSTLV